MTDTTVATAPCRPRRRSLNQYPPGCRPRGKCKLIVIIAPVASVRRTQSCDRKGHTAPERFSDHDEMAVDLLLNESRDLGPSLRPLHCPSQGPCRRDPEYLCTARISSAASVMKKPCSMERTPASAAARIAASPFAWAITAQAMLACFRNDEQGHRPPRSRRQ